MATTAWLRGPIIGRGATATVSLASSETGFVFAVKTAPFSHSALLQREQKFLSSFNSPSIVSCLGFDITTEAGGALYYNLFLEFANGGSLTDEIKRFGGHLKEADIRVRARDILAGLAHLHDAGVVHGDVKPGNVLIGSDGRAKIGDLGCAKWISEEEKEIRGSPMYMAPEALRREEQSIPADIWSFGCTVIEMATGKPPCPDSTDAFEKIYRIGFSDEIPTIPDFLSDEAKDFLNKCLMSDPMERWTADELLRHPFIECPSCDTICTELNWISPKSILDQRLWDEIDDVVDDEKELIDESIDWRIQELASGTAGPDWTWDEDWTAVRNLSEDYKAETEKEFNHIPISDKIASTSGIENLKFDQDNKESCERDGWEERDYAMLNDCCKNGIVQFGKNRDCYSLIFLFGSLLPLLSWHFTFGLSTLLVSIIELFRAVLEFVCQIYAKWMVPCLSQSIVIKVHSFKIKQFF